MVVPRGPPPPPPHIKERGNAHSSPRVGRRDSGKPGRQLVTPWWGIQGSRRLGKTLGAQTGHPLLQEEECFSPPGPRMPGLMPISPSLDNHPEKEVSSSTLGLETQGRPIAPVVWLGRAVPYQGQRKGCWLPCHLGLSGCGPLCLGSLNGDHCPIPAPGVGSGWREEGCHLWSSLLLMMT